jgi:hypothetical protein
MIMDNVGMDGLVRFYRTVGSGTPVDAALVRGLGMTHPMFVAAWRSYLVTRLT